jgi:hypothetical protein
MINPHEKNIEDKYKKTITELTKKLDDFCLECNNNIENILKNKPECIIDTNTNSHSYYVRDLPYTDQDIKLGNKCNFLWLRDILDVEYFNSTKFFWLDCDGEIDKTDKQENSNLYLDKLGFLITRVKDKYGEYGEFWECRIDCYYNDVVYEMLKMKRDTRLTNMIIRDKNHNQVQ